METLENIDANLFLWLNGFAESWLDYFLGWPTFLGDPIFLAPVVLTFLLIWNRRGTLRTMSLILVASLLGGILVRLLKGLCGRQRPYNHFLPRWESGEIDLHYLFSAPVRNAFPSGHSALVIGVVVALHCIYGRRMIFLYPLAMVVALSRVYVGAHYPGDVLGGMVVGGSVSWLVVTGFKRWRGAASAQSRPQP